MLNEIRNNIAINLQGEFTPQQLKTIDFAIAQAMRGYRVEKEETLPAVQEMALPPEIQEFFVRKSMKGCSNGTIQRYRELLCDFCIWLNKDIKATTDMDILVYLAVCKKRGNSDRTLEGKRRTFSSFFTFLHDSGKMPINPVRTIEPIKFKSKVREPLNDMELEIVRNACQTPREKALFEVLYSTGCRVSEVVGMDYSKINQQNRSIIVTGKGNKERTVLFNAKSILAIKIYMASRDDDNPALFVSEREPHKRLQKEAIERVIHIIGERSGIGREVFPHLFRHTMATDMLNRGTPITEVQHLLGHEKPETTEIYLETSDELISQSHKRCIV